MSRVCIFIACLRFQSVDRFSKPRYGRRVSNSDTVFEALKELVSVSNPGLVTKEDLSRVESRLDELGLFLDEIEARIFEPECDETELQENPAEAADDFDDSL